MSTIHDRLKELRTITNLSQREFGEKINLVKSCISNMEKSKRSVTDRTIKSICNEFGVSREWLEHGEGEMFKTESDLLEGIALKLDDFDDLDKKFILYYTMIPDNLRKVVKDLMKDFINKMGT